MAGTRRTVRLNAQLWGHLDSMATGMGVLPEALLRSAVATLAQFHGYSIGGAEHPVRALAHMEVPEPERLPPPVALAEPEPDAIPEFDAEPIPEPEAEPIPAPEPEVEVLAQPAVEPQPLADRRPLGTGVSPLPTRVEGLDHKMPVIEAVASENQPAPQLDGPEEGAIPTGLEPSMQAEESPSVEMQIDRALELLADVLEPKANPGVPTGMVPAALAPNPDDDPTRRAAADRIRDIERDLERIALPRGDGPLVLDFEAAEVKTVV